MQLLGLTWRSIWEGKYVFVCLFVVLLLETGFLCVPLTVLELALQTTLASNSQICLPLPGIKGVANRARQVEGGAHRTQSFLLGLHNCPARARIPMLPDLNPCLVSSLPLLHQTLFHLSFLSLWLPGSPALLA